MRLCALSATFATLKVVEGFGDEVIGLGPHLPEVWRVSLDPYLPRVSPQSPDSELLFGHRLIC